jgi:hypothetical protein
MSDRGFPDAALQPSPGAAYNSRGWTNNRPYANDSQNQSPVSPIDTSLPYDFQNGRGPPGAYPRDNSPADGRTGRRQDMNRDYRGREYSDLNDRDGSRPAARGLTKSPGSTPRICKKCNEPLTGQFVRALGGTFHLECFKCNVSSFETALVPENLLCAFTDI